MDSPHGVNNSLRATIPGDLAWVSCLGGDFSMTFGLGRESRREHGASLNKPVYPVLPALG